MTWIGSLGVVIKMGENNMTKIRFEASTKTIHIDNRVAASAKNVGMLVIKGGRLRVSEVERRRKGAIPEVDVEILDAGISFSVRFMRNHIDMLWHEVGKELAMASSHGIIGITTCTHIEYRPIVF